MGEVNNCTGGEILVDEWELLGSGAGSEGRQGRKLVVK